MSVTFRTPSLDPLPLLRVVDPLTAASNAQA
jgi:hypothetical protein